MKLPALGLLLLLSYSQAQRAQAFTGVISDDVCAKADHSGMRMGSNDAECATACVDAHGASFVLYDGKDSFKLVGTPSPRPFAGQKVRVDGDLDAKTKTLRIKAITKL